MSGGTIDALIRFNGRVAQALAGVAAVFLVMIAVVTFCDVFARYLFLRPFTFTVEVTELGMALMVFLAVGLVTHDDAHINVDVVTLRLLAATRAILGLITNVLALTFVLLMCWRLWLQAFFLLGKGDKTQIWGIPYWPVAVVMAAGSLLIATGILVQIVRVMRGMRGETAPPSAAPTKPFTD